MLYNAIYLYYIICKLKLQSNRSVVKNLNGRFAFCSAGVTTRNFGCEDSLILANPKVIQHQWN